jgi:hypothetical protein
MPNRLTVATSPYLLQHADNPVEWWEWEPQALAEARRRNVPILLSVGYAACHWCHVMAHESFEDPEIADLMNREFVNIKVDREERPDIDAVYMTATQAMTGQGGWPMTCFLTPEGKPFHCGTYYPPSPRFGVPGFKSLLDAVVLAWKEEREELSQSADRLTSHLGELAVIASQSDVDDSVLAKAAEILFADADKVHGGFGAAPKFPPAMVLEFLLRHHERTGSREALSVVDSTMDAMARGGIYDQLAGGFCRYSVDSSWVVPHFEKMLYDNALLVKLYAHIARRTDSPLARKVVVETVSFLLNSLITPERGFASSLDADAAGREGLTYVWNQGELNSVLGEEDGRWAAELFQVTKTGTFEDGYSTLQLREIPVESERFSRVREKLLSARETRPQPALDDKLVTAWNGLAISALAEAGIALDRPQWIIAAEEAARFLMSCHFVDNQLRRSSRGGVAGHARGILEDYACLAEGLLQLHQATAEPRWLNDAVMILDAALAKFSMPGMPGAFFDTADDAETLVHRPSDITDNATPAGASALASALLTASALVGGDHAAAHRQVAEDAMKRAAEFATKAPRFAGNWLSVGEAMRHGPIQIAVVDIPSGHGDLNRNMSTELLPTAVRLAPGGAIVLKGEPDAAGVPLLADRPMLSGRAAAYVCRGYVCDRPVSTTEELVELLTGK